jgi:hypothetical protein
VGSVVGVDAIEIAREQVVRAANVRCIWAEDRSAYSVFIILILPGAETGHSVRTAFLPEGLFQMILENEKAKS